MKNPSLYKMAQMAGDNRSAYKHVVKKGPSKGQDAGSHEGAALHNAAHARGDYDMNHQKPTTKKEAIKIDTKKEASPMKAHKPGHDTPKEGGMLDQVDVKAKRGRKKFYETTATHPSGGTETFKHKKDGTVVRRDDITANELGGKSGGGFVNRLKKEGLGSAIANIAPVRLLRSVKRELGGNLGQAITGKRRKQNPEHLKGKHKLTKTKK